LTFNADKDDLPPLAPLDMQAEESATLDSWSPPTPESIPFNTRSETVSPTYLQPTTGNAPSVSLMGLLREDHPLPSLFITGGRNLLQRINETDAFASLRDTGEVDIHYPFGLQQEWQLAKWLASAPLSQVDINKFLQLDYVSNYSLFLQNILILVCQIQKQPPSFTSAQDLINWVEVLPEVPHWSYQTIVIPGYKTKNPMTLFWHDGLEVIAHLFANPVFAHCMEFSPYALFDQEDCI